MVRAAIWGVLVLTAWPAAAASPPAIVTQGAGSVPACEACHGQAADAQFPRLGGQPDGYLIKQLNDFKSGQRSNALMQQIAGQLSNKDLNEAAQWYASQPHPKPGGPAPNADSVARGAMLATTGDWPRGIPACQDCHGPKGSGVAPSFPALRGQSPAYIMAQLNSWKRGQRNNGPMHLMGGVAAALSGRDVRDVAVYFGSLRGSP